MERADGYVQLGAEREYVDPSSERRWLLGPQNRPDGSSFTQARLVIRSNLCVGLCIGAERNFTMNLAIKTSHNTRVLLVLGLALLACLPLATSSSASTHRTSNAQDSSLSNVG